MLRASANSLHVTSIYHTPSHIPAEAAPYAFMLEVDGLHVLLDCGWDDGFDTSYLRQIKPFAQKADAVLLSSPEMRACGALPYVLAHLPPHAVVSSASSTAKMGLHAVLHTFLYQYANEHRFVLTHNTADETTTTTATRAQRAGWLSAHTSSSRPTSRKPAHRRTSGDTEESFTLSVDAIYSAFRSVREPYGDVVRIRGKESRGEGVKDARAREDAEESGNGVNAHVDASANAVDVWMLNASEAAAGGAAAHRREGTAAAAEEDVVELSCRCIFAGRMLGGYSWLMRYHVDEILYCADFSLKPSSMLKPFVVPTTANVVLLADFAMHMRGGGGSASGMTDTLPSERLNHTNANSATHSEDGNHKMTKGLRRYEEQLQMMYRHIQTTLRSGSGVLIPVNIAGRGLEVLHLVVRWVNERGGGTYKIVFAGLQAKEILEKAVTTTEALQDEIILSERGLFADVLPCRTAAEVMAVTGAKVCIADGDDSLHFGLAAELLEHFVAPHIHGGQNLILLTDSMPRAGGESNAARLVDAAVGEEVELTVRQRVRLNKEELEAYYLQREAEAEETRRAWEEAQTARVQQSEGDGNETTRRRRRRDTRAGHDMAQRDSEDAHEDEDDIEDDADEDEDEDEDEERDDEHVESDAAHAVRGSRGREVSGARRAHGESDTQTTPRASSAGVRRTRATAHTNNTPGLTLPSHLHLRSRFLHFPSVDSVRHTLHSALVQGEGVAYGLPVSDAEQFVLHARAPMRAFSDAGPEALPLVDNDAQREANVPCKMMTQTVRVRRHCRVVVLTELSGYAESAALKTMLRTRLSFAKKLVGLRGSAEDGRRLVQFCRAEKSLKCGEGVYIPTHTESSSSSSSSSADSSVSREMVPVPISLATHVYSYVVQLNPATTQSLTRTLRRVRERGAAHVWEVGWVNGELQGRRRRRCDGSADKESQPIDTEKVDDEETGESGTRRADAEGRSMIKKTDEEEPLSLSLLHGTRAQMCARHREESGLEGGSFFVGHVDLARLRDQTRRESGLWGEFHKKAPMLVYDEGICVRKGSDGTVTLSSMADPSMFDVRRSVYKQYSQIL